MMSLLEINKHITFYCARNSFATYLKFNNVSIGTIGEMLGHKNIKSTQSYLNKLPSKYLDQIVDDLFNQLEN
jgi:integrase/recombinase XerD